jgi:hypothetical protein
VDPLGDDVMGQFGRSLTEATHGGGDDLMDLVFHRSP